MEEELASYKLQLQQVEAALLGDPTNVELLKLKEDLGEIISLQVVWKKAEKMQNFRKKINKNWFFSNFQEDLAETDKAESSERAVVAPQVIHKWTVRIFSEKPRFSPIFQLKIDFSGRRTSYRPTSRRKKGFRQNRLTYARRSGYYLHM